MTPPLNLGGKEADSLLQVIGGKFRKFLGPFKGSPEAILKRWASAGIVFTLLLISLVSFLAWRSTLRVEKGEVWVVHTLTVEQELESGLGHAVSAENQARGFAVTGRETFLIAFREQQEGLVKDLAAVRHLTSDNASQQLRLNLLESQVNAVNQFERTIDGERQRAGNNPSDEELLAEKRLLDAVRGTFAGMRGEEERLLILRVAETQHAARLTRTAIVSGALAGVVSLILAGFMLLHQINRSVRMQRRLWAEEQRSAESRREDTELREANRALAESEERFRLLVGPVKEYAIYMVDPEGRVLTWNEGAERSKGYKAEEVLGRNFSIFFLPEDAEAGLPAQELAAAARDGRFETEGWRLRKDGTRFWALVTLTAIRGQDGALRGFAKVTRDTTSQKKAAEALLSFNAQLEHYRIVVEHIDEYAIYTLDAEGIITSWGTGAQKVSGASAEQVMGRHYSFFFPAAAVLAGEPQRELAEAARTGRFAVDAWMVSPDGDRKWSSGVLNSVRDESGKLTGFIRVARDMTKQKKMEDSLQRLAGDLENRVEQRTHDLQATLKELHRKNEEVEAFVYIVSHDLRAPLVNVQGFVRELEDSSTRLTALLNSCSLPEPSGSMVKEILDDEIAGALHFISASATKFERLIDALIGLSRLGRQAYEMVQVDVAELVAEALATFNQALTEAGAVVDAGLLPPVYADATALGQVFSNLIGNALKYRSPQRPLEIEIGGRVEDGTVHYWVADNGLGIPESGKARLFQVFQRLHPQAAPGEGMGLAIVHRIVERHQGKVWAESRQDKGTTFHFSLPSNPGPTTNVDLEIITHGAT